MGIFVATLQVDTGRYKSIQAVIFLLTVFWESQKKREEPRQAPLYGEKNDRK